MMVVGCILYFYMLLNGQRYVDKWIPSSFLIHMLHFGGELAPTEKGAQRFSSKVIPIHFLPTTQISVTAIKNTYRPRPTYDYHCVKEEWDGFIISTKVADYIDAERSGTGTSAATSSWTQVATTSWTQVATTYTATLLFHCIGERELTIGDTCTSYDTSTIS